MEGTVGLYGGAGSVVRTAASRPTDPALMLTNGHCVDGKPPAPGSALADQFADRDVPIADRQGYPQTTAHTSRLVYATMTGTDIALYRLEETYVAGGHIARRLGRVSRGGGPCGPVLRRSADAR
ncbi:hypothetical protein [Streptomyces hygroscopicus]|uniref:hypothetical protein n=1 Tax=Streptomyces hygroscopicus TaxID=1912 RepID=UPI0037AC5022